MARKRRKRNTLTSDIGGFVGAGVGIGVGSAIVSGAGGSSAGLATMGGMMPILGTGIMAKHALRGVRKLHPKKRKKRK